MGVEIARVRVRSCVRTFTVAEPLYAINLVRDSAGELYNYMTFTYNRSAFRSPVTAPNQPCSPLLCAYATLVALELFLKDHLTRYVVSVPNSHDVPNLLKTLARHLDKKHSGTISSVASQLSTKLANLWCRGKDGIATPVPSNSYPYMRYLRHDSDWSSSASTDAELNAVLSISKQIMQVLYKATGEKV